MALSRDGRSTRLGPGEVYFRCGSCRRTDIGEPDRKYCTRCGPTMADIEIAIEASRPRCPNCDQKHDRLEGRVYCSKRCFNAHRAQDALDMAEAFRAELNLGAATGWLHRLFGYLSERDGTGCYLCGKRIDMDRKDAMGPSVDHLIPRSHGGTHDLANVALVHRRCNSRKGNRAANEQLRLIG